MMAIGMTTSFAALGMFAGLFGSAAGLSPESVRRFAAGLLTAFGLITITPALNRGFTNLVSPLASAANQASSSLNTGSLKGAFLMGSLLGMIWSPCSGPLLGSALTLVATEGGAVHGTLLLDLFGAGAAVPLIGVAYLTRFGTGRIQSWVALHGDQSKKALGLVFLLVGVAILSGTDRLLESQINDWLPDSWLALSTRI
jgi:cytochrome c biogenesis protein CcdA